MKKVVLAALVVWLLVLVPDVRASKPISGGTECATAQTAGANHIAVDWPAGQFNPTNTYAGVAPTQDMFGVLSCGDGRHVEYQWLTGFPKPGFTWGN